MDYHSRRRRRGGCQSRPNIITNRSPLPCNSKPWSFLSGLYSFLIMSSLMALIYMMLEYHCGTCSSRYDLQNITKSVEGIVKNLTVMKEDYNDLEIKISKFSQEIPKIEGQIEILEALANNIETKDGWNPKTHLTFPNVDVYLTRPGPNRSTNISVKCSKHLNETLMEVD